jgi:hypothetical protein
VLYSSLKLIPLAPRTVLGLGGPGQGTVTSRSASSAFLSLAAPLRDVPGAEPFGPQRKKGQSVWTGPPAWRIEELLCYFLAPAGAVA